MSGGEGRREEGEDKEEQGEEADKYDDQHV